MLFPFNVAIICTQQILCYEERTFISFLKENVNFFPPRMYPKLQILNSLEGRIEKASHGRNVFVLWYVNVYCVHIITQKINRLNYIYPRNTGFAQSFCTGADNLKHPDDKGRFTHVTF